MSLESRKATYSTVNWNLATLAYSDRESLIWTRIFDSMFPAHRDPMWYRILHSVRALFLDEIHFDMCLLLRLLTLAELRSCRCLPTWLLHLFYNLDIWKRFPIRFRQRPVRSVQDPYKISIVVTHARFYRHSCHTQLEMLPKRCIWTHRSYLHHRRLIF